MDALLNVSAPFDAGGNDESDGLEATAFAELKTDPGPASIKSVTRELEKLRCIDGLKLPERLFHGVAHKLLLTYRRRGRRRASPRTSAPSETGSIHAFGGFCVAASPRSDRRAHRALGPDRPQHRCAR